MAGEKSTTFMGVPLLLIGGIIGFVAISIAVICILGAVFLYTSASPFMPYAVKLGFRFWVPVPNFGYTWTTQAISDLGVGPTSFMFNVGLIITGILCFLFFPTLLGSLGYSRTSKIGVLIGVVAGAALIGIGVFSEVASFQHNLFSILFWMLIALAAGILSYAMRSSTVFSNTVQWIGYFEFVGGWILGILTKLYGAIPEWLMLLVLVIWIYALSNNMIIKGKTA
ncbi:MAG: hypothetical protein ACUVXA_06315 [Candidatus Jordarchaeum sp.]|uniref:hypothetical protein n=1 Tax=Candidatus Jordarchaeum sp. TaxID=2823881 RepID=UPI004049C797